MRGMTGIRVAEDLGWSGKLVVFGSDWKMPEEWGEAWFSSPNEGLD